MQDEREKTLQTLDEIVEAHLLQDHDDMKLPFHVALLCINGSSLVVRYVETSNRPERVILAEHMEGGTFALPIVVMVMDVRGVTKVQRLPKRSPKR
jgi:hypothetical protein